MAPVVEGGGDLDEGGGVEAAFHGEGEPLIARCGWCGGDTTGEVEEAGACLVGAPFFGVGDRFADLGGDGGVAVAALGEEGKGLEVFFALGEAIGLPAGVFEVLGGVVGTQSIV